MVDPGGEKRIRHGDVSRELVRFAGRACGVHLASGCAGGLLDRGEYFSFEDHRVFDWRVDSFDFPCAPDGSQNRGRPLGSRPFLGIDF